MQRKLEKAAREYSPDKRLFCLQKFIRLMTARILLLLLVFSHWRYGDEQFFPHFGRRANLECPSLGTIQQALENRRD
jgi:hypothetical protein